MNLFNSVIPNTPTNYPPTVSYTAIFHDDDILAFTDPLNPDTTLDEKISKIGLIKGIIEFGCKFDESTQVKFIDTEKQRFIVGEIDEYTYVLCVNLPYIVNETVSYHSKGIANSEYLLKYLRKGLEIYKLNHGDFSDRGELDQWWKSYVMGFELEYQNEGILLNLTNNIRHSSVKLPIGLYENLNLKIESVMEENDIVQLSAMNLSKDVISNYGIFYKSKVNGLSDYNVIELLSILQFIDYQCGITKNSIMLNDLTPLPKNDEPIPDTDFSIKNFLQDPITKGIYEPVNATMALVGGILPTWGQQDAVVESEPVQSNGEFLTDGKEIYLDGEKYQLILYKIDNYLISVLSKLKLNNDKILPILHDEIYDIYIKDIPILNQEDPFQYIIINQNNFYSSLPLIKNEDDLKLHNSILNFKLNLNININKESIFKNNGYWLFYHYDTINKREIYLIKKDVIEHNTKRDDMKKLFIKEQNDEFVVALGNDVLKFWQSLNKDDLFN